MAVVRIDGVYDDRVLLVALAYLGTQIYVASGILVRQRLADIVQDSGTPGKHIVSTHLSGHDSGKVGHLQGVPQGVLPVAGAVAQPAYQLDNLGVHGRKAQIHDYLLTLFEHLLLELFGNLFVDLLYARRLYAAVFYQELYGSRGYGTAVEVEAAQYYRTRRIVYYDVHTQQHLERLDVAPLLAYDPPFELVVGKMYDIYEPLRGELAGKACSRLRQNIVRFPLGLYLRLGFIFSHYMRYLAARILFGLFEDKLFRLFGSQA